MLKNLTLLNLSLGILLLVLALLFQPLHYYLQKGADAEIQFVASKVLSAQKLEVATRGGRGSFIFFNDLTAMRRAMRQLRLEDSLVPDDLILEAFSDGEGGLVLQLFRMPRSDDWFGSMPRVYRVHFNSFKNISKTEWIGIDQVPALGLLAWLNSILFGAPSAPENSAPKAPGDISGAPAQIEPVPLPLPPPLPAPQGKPS